MSLIEAVTNVANECGYTVDSTVITSSDQTTKQLLAIANRVIREMAITYPWSKFFAQGSITLVDGQASYALPSAFSYYHYETFWNQSTRWRVLGPMSPEEYAQIVGYGLITTVYQRFMLRGITDTQLLISPTPSAANDGDIIIFEYMSDRAVRPRTWTGNGSGFHPAVGDYCSYNGNYYVAADSAYTDATPPTHTSGTVSDGGVNWTYYSGAYSTFLADEDEPVLPQRVLEQGMLERFAEIHGLEGVQSRFDDQLAQEFGNDTPGKVMYAGGDTSRLIFARSGRAVFGTWI